MSEREEVARLRLQARGLSHFGGHALRARDLDSLLQEACGLVSASIGVELVKVLQLLPDRDTLLVRAGVNWKPGVVGHATFGAHEKSPGGYALREDEPVISVDVATEHRFEIPHLLLEHGVRSMVNVVIGGERAAWGVLEVDSHQHRSFDQDDVSFLQNYANLIAAAIERLQIEAELRDAADRASFLLGELQHRVKNMLLNVRALARRTARSSSDIAAFADAFDARLLALARTQDLFTSGSNATVRLDDTLRQELQAHGAESGIRVRLSGPDVRLPPETAQALGMVFHELATNASKHGALRYDKAKLAVSWQTVRGEQGDELLFVWRESGVPINSPPARRGFGTEAIERSLPHMLGGDSRLEFHSDGVECTIQFPLSQATQPTE
jgi:two-component sensor histidine kinase